MKDEIPEGWSLEAADFINRLLQKKESLRLGSQGLEEVLNHPWIKDLSHEMKGKEDFSEFSLEIKELGRVEEKKQKEEDLFKKVFGKREKKKTKKEDRFGMRNYSKGSLTSNFFKIRSGFQ